MRRATRICGRRRALAAALALFAAWLAPVPHAGAAAPAAEFFRLDQRFGSIGFRVSNLGLFTSHGHFGRFVGRLLIDPAHPERTRIEVTVAADSIETPWERETAMLRSPDFFDVARFPEIRFTSDSVLSEGPRRYTIRGRIELRGVTRPIVLAAQLVRQGTEASSSRRIDDFIVTGTLRRSAFGMTTDPLFISDRVAITIHARIILDAANGR